VSGPPDARPEDSTTGGRSPRLRLAGGLLLVAVATGGLAVGLFHEEGLAALYGRSAVGTVESCTSGRHRTCSARLRGPAGSLATYVDIANSGASDGDVVRVRVRNGKAVPDSTGDRVMTLVLPTLFAVVAAVAFSAAACAAFGWTMPGWLPGTPDAEAGA
jgi:hypothetical protein